MMMIGDFWLCFVFSSDDGVGDNGTEVKDDVVVVYLLRSLSQFVA